MAEPIDKLPSSPYSGGEYEALVSSLIYDEYTTIMNRAGGNGLTSNDIAKLYEYATAYHAGFIPWELFTRKQLFARLCEIDPQLRAVVTEADEDLPEDIGNSPYRLSRDGYRALCKLGWKDLGVDAVSQNFDVSLQAKHYSAKSRVTWEQISTFYAFSDMYLKSTQKWLVTSNYPKFTNTDIGYLVKTSTLNLFQFSDEESDGLVQRIVGERSEIQKEIFETSYAKVLRKCQKEAFAAIVEDFHMNSATSVAMPCGSGKTVLVLEIIKWWRGVFRDFPNLDTVDLGFGDSDEFDGIECSQETSFGSLESHTPDSTGGKVVVFVPSLLLVDQFAEVCKKYLGLDCHKVSGDSQYESGHDIYVCTYHSAKKIRGTCGLVVVDEAHHVDLYESGRPDSRISECSADDKIQKGRIKSVLAEMVHSVSRNKLLYVSATPKREPLCYEYSIGDAIADKILAEYQVAVPLITDGKPPIDAIVERVSVNPEWRHILAYCNTVLMAKIFSDRINEKLGGLVCETFDGSTHVKVREQIMDKFKSGKIRCLSTVHVLAEGIDIPNADTCIFVEPRHSKIDIVQCVGRVLRNPIDNVKPFATVVLPTTSEKNELRRFVWAMSKHDSRIADEIRERSFGRIYLEPGQDFDDNQAEIIGYEFYTRLELETLFKEDSDWMIKYQLLKNYVDENHSIPTESTQYKNVNIGSWISRQRRNHTKGKLSEEREKKLEAIDGWTWGKSRKTKPLEWDEIFEILKNYVDENHSIPTESTQYKNVNIGSWISTQRANHTKGKLSEEREKKLEAIDGWTWGESRKTKPLEWDEILEILKNYVDENHSIPTVTTQYKNVKSGRWINTQRQRHTKGKLSEEREKKLEAIDGWWWMKK